MKTCSKIIALMAVVILMLISFLYKQSRGTIYWNFPVNLQETNSADAPFYLYIFFSKHDCPPCLAIIDELNQLSSPLTVVGVVPDDELKEELTIRQMTGARFKLIGRNDYKKYIPIYTPTIIGTSEKGVIFFILPCVPNEKDYFYEFLMSFYQKIYPALLPQIKK